MGELLQRKYWALRKCLGIILSLVMVLSTMTFTAIETNADDEPTSTSGELEVSTWTITVNGVELTEETTIDVTEGDDVYIVIEWEFDGTYDSDDNYEKIIDLSLSGVVLDNTYYNEIQYIVVGSETVGEWYINDKGQIVATLYSSYLKGNSGKYGGFEINGNVEIDTSTQNQDGTYNITLGDYTYKVNYTQSTGWVNVSKTKGNATIDTSTGTVTQEFTVTIKAYSSDITLSRIIDTPTGYTLGDSYTVSYSDGTASQNYNSIGAVSDALSGTTLKADETITITYTATVDLESVLKSSNSYNAYKNRIDVTYKDVNGKETTKESTAYDVSVTKPSVSKTANSYDESTGTITWTISVDPGDLINLSDFNLSGIVVTDTADSNQNEGQVTIPWTSFTDNDGDGVYTYTYTTTLTDAALNSATSVSASNAVDVKFMDGVSKSTSKSYTATKSILKKSDGVYDSSTGLVAWTITIAVPDTGLSGSSGYVKIYDTNDNNSGYMPTSSIVVNGETIYKDGGFVGNYANILYIGQNYNENGVGLNWLLLCLSNSYVADYAGKTITIVVYSDPDEDNLADGETVKNTVELSSDQQSESDTGTWTYVEPIEALEKTGTLSSTDDYTIDYTVSLTCMIFTLQV